MKNILIWILKGEIVENVCVGRSTRVVVVVVMDAWCLVSASVVWTNDESWR